MAYPVSGTVDNAGATSGANSGLGAALDPSTQSLGKDAFLKLLIAQISHQDPLKPMDDTAFVAQLAQFSVVEQAISTNQKLDFLALQQQGQGNSQTASLVGKVVSVRGDRVTLDGQGLSVPVNFTLGSPAKTVSVSVKDAHGKTVRAMQLGSEPAGLIRVSWDGKDDSGMTQPAGTYTISVDAKSETGAPVEVQQQSSGVLKSVSFDQGYALLELNNGVTAPASDLLKVGDGSP